MCILYIELHAWNLKESNIHFSVLRFRPTEYFYIKLIYYNRRKKKNIHTVSTIKSSPFYVNICKCCDNGLRINVTNQQKISYSSQFA